MKPDSEEPAELLNLLRQQLLLAQVRIMELEDVRDELAPRLTETAALLAAAQSLVESKADEASHLEKVRSDLQAQFDHLRHTQHITNAALNAARAETASVAAREKELLARIDRLQAEATLLTETGHQQGEQISALENRVRASETVATQRAARIQQLDLEHHALKASRSWRWTAWLRAIERRLK